MKHRRPARHGGGPFIWAGGPLIQADENSVQAVRGVAGEGRLISSSRERILKSAPP